MDVSTVSGVFNMQGEDSVLGDPGCRVTLDLAAMKVRRVIGSRKISRVLTENITRWRSRACRRSAAGAGWRSRPSGWPRSASPSGARSRARTVCRSQRWAQVIMTHHTVWNIFAFFPENHKFHLTSCWCMFLA